MMVSDGHMATVVQYTGSSVAARVFDRSQIVKDSFCERDWEKDRLDYLGLIDLPQ